MAAQQKGASRKASHKTNESNLLNWQNFQTKKTQHVGKKPLPEPTSVGQIAVMVIMHVCRKIVLMDPGLKVAFYLAALFFGSLTSDFVPFPRSYFSYTENVFNKYFVKLGWGWTLVVVGTFVALTSWTYCCGRRQLVKRHACRLAVGTAVWFFITEFFRYVEGVTGTCSKHGDTLTTRAACLRQGHRWLAFDISGHAFLLIYCSLIIMEESRCIRGWERIGDLLRYEAYEDDSPLRVLGEKDLSELSSSYAKFTPYIRALFVGATMLLVLWDVMLVVTILYFHTMIQKMIGAIFAICAWFITYRVWYLGSVLSPGLPGDGPFRYADVAPQSNSRRSVCRN